VTPKFCKHFGHVGTIVQQALQDYRKEVTERIFPGPDHTPYRMGDGEADKFVQLLKKEGLREVAEQVEHETTGR
jgi:3-methyl-2-oxobutanoate hydroxymethyltransferase